MGVDVEMFAEISSKVTPEEILVVSRKLVECLGSGAFWLRDEFHDWLNAVPAKGQTKPHALIPVNGSEYVPARKGRRLVLVSVSTRFYGIGYERGHLVSIAATARFLRLRWPDSRIFYGGDSGGELDEWTDEFEQKLWAHYAEHGHEPYRGGFGQYSNEAQPIKAPTCGRCLVPMMRFGWGGNGNFGSWSCQGCDDLLETRDGGRNYTRPTDDESKPANLDLDVLEGRNVVLVDGPRIYLDTGRAFGRPFDPAKSPGGLDGARGPGDTGRVSFDLRDAVRDLLRELVEWSRLEIHHHERANEILARLDSYATIHPRHDRGATALLLLKEMVRAGVQHGLGEQDTDAANDLWRRVRELLAEDVTGAAKK